jgi:hypothetical protein
LGKAFDKAKMGDDIEDVPCKNPKCGKPALRVVGRNKDSKIIECQGCFWRVTTATAEGIVFRKGED